MTRISSSKQVSSDQLLVDINRVTGESGQKKPAWSLVLQRRTGRYAGGEEVKEAFGWWYHSGNIGRRQSIVIGRWLNANNAGSLHQPVMTKISEIQR